MGEVIGGTEGRCRGDPSDPEASAASVRCVTESTVSSLVHLPMTRRAVLLGGASALALAACSSKSSTGTASGTTSKPTGSLLAFFPLNGYITAQVPQRVAFGVANAGGGLAKTGPNPLAFSITGPGGSRAVQKVAMHGHDLPNAYYPIYFTPEKAGNYTVSTVFDGSKISASFAVGAKGSSDVPGPTDKMPAMVTPTVDDHLGVNPICTQDPACPLHTITLKDALATAKPVAFLVGTPKFCQTGICGPVLQVLETTAPDYAGKVTFIHQEVYQSATQAAEDGPSATLTKAVQELNMQSEPVLWIIGGNGIIRYRLDAAYDEKELRAALDDVLA